MTRHDNSPAPAAPKSEHPALAWAWLLLGAALLTLGHGRPAVGIAAWLAPIFILRFTRSQRALVAFAAFVVVHTLAWEIAFLGTVPMPAAARISVFVSLSLAFGGVILLDRWLMRRRPGLAATLLFPCGWVTFEYLVGTFSPTGSWGSIAYTFSETTTLAQVASITGWTGITFLVGWTASVVSWAWGRGWDVRACATGLITCGAVVALAWGWGAVRLMGSGEPAQTVPVALIAAPGTFSAGEHFDELWRYTRGVEQSPDDVRAAIRQIEASQQQHFALVEREIAAGAKIVAWAEANAYVTEAEEKVWLDEARILAFREKVYIGLGLFVFRPHTQQPAENKFVLVGPDGEVAMEFLKATRVPGSSHVVGDGTLPRVETEHGALTAAICFDLDFPGLMRQAGRMEADMLLAPSNDWTEVRDLHARMAIMRAIESGVSLVRPTKDGISIVTDPYGNVLARLDTDEAARQGGETVLTALAPTEGVGTVYARVGDALSWLCAAGLLGLVVWGVRRER